MKHKKGLAILITLAAIAVIAGVHSLLTTDFGVDFETDFDYDDEAEDTLDRVISFVNKDKNTAPKSALKKPYVSVIYITGVISEENKTYNQKWLLRQIKNAKSDKNNRAILLYIDSPGGTVYESDEAYLALRDYASTRPVFAYFGSLAASGGYYIGCSADWIFANRNTLTGSIGVIAGQSVDATGLFDKIGVKVTTITAGKNKNMGNYNAPLTEEQRAIMQSIADEAYEQFTGIVADARDLPIETVKRLADGRIYTAKQAKDNGLIDEVCSLDDAKDTIRDELAEDTDESVNFVDFKYHYEENWMSLLYGASSFIKNPEARVYELLGKNAGTCLYLYQ